MITLTISHNTPKEEINEHILHPAFVNGRNFIIGRKHIWYRLSDTWIEEDIRKVCQVLNLNIISIRKAKDKD